MITAIVRYKLPATIVKMECREHFLKIAKGSAKQKGQYANSLFGTRAERLAASISGKPSMTRKAFTRAPGSRASCLVTPRIQTSNILRPSL